MICSQVGSRTHHPWYHHLTVIRTPTPRIDLRLTIVLPHGFEPKSPHRKWGILTLRRQEHLIKTTNRLLSGIMVGILPTSCCYRTNEVFRLFHYINLNYSHLRLWDNKVFASNSGVNLISPDTVWYFLLPFSVNQFVVLMFTNIQPIFQRTKR